jgi:hypothetical protein
VEKTFIGDGSEFKRTSSNFERRLNSEHRANNFVVLQQEKTGDIVCGKRDTRDSGFA